MTPSHHLPFELLLDHAVGALTPAMALLVEGHLALCPACRAEVVACTDVGGALLETIEPVAVSDDAFEQLMARIDNETALKTAPARAPAAAVPAALPTMAQGLRRTFERTLARRSWRRVMPGVRLLDLDLPKVARGLAQMISVDGGRAVPRHSHGGAEYTLVLAGGYSDASGSFGPGDVQITDPSVMHKPVADRGETCVVYAVSDAPIRLAGPLGLVQRALGR